ncbi:MAG: UPF0262 family protein [Qingshengfaniella sp.]
MTAAHLAHVELADEGRGTSAVNEQERRVAVFDLLEENSFALTDGPAGPYRLRLDSGGGKVHFHVASDNDTAAVEFRLAEAPMRQVIKDYTQICNSYYEAVRLQGPAEIEALDEARRAIHLEGGRLLQEGLDGHARLDVDTARRLFTLICAFLPAK